MEMSIHAAITSKAPTPFGQMAWSFWFPNTQWICKKTCADHEDMIASLGHTGFRENRKASKQKRQIIFPLLGPGAQTLGSRAKFLCTIPHCPDPTENICLGGRRWKRPTEARVESNGIWTPSSADVLGRRRWNCCDWSFHIWCKHTWCACTQDILNWGRTQNQDLFFCVFGACA